MRKGKSIDVNSKKVSMLELCHKHLKQTVSSEWFNEQLWTYSKQMKITESLSKELGSLSKKKKKKKKIHHEYC